MTDNIHLRFDIRAYNEAAINARMLHGHNGPLKSASFFLLPLAGAVALGVLAGTLFLNQPWDRAALVAGYAGLGSFVTALLMGYRNRIAVARLLQSSPLRQEPYEVTVSDQAVNRNGRLYPWSVFTGVFILPGMTVLQFSPLEGIPLPDRELPEGLSPEALRTHIEHWRKATT